MYTITSLLAARGASLPSQANVVARKKGDTGIH